MRQHAALIRQQLAAQRAHRLARSNIFLVSRMSLSQKSFAYLFHPHVTRPKRGKKNLHPVNRPEKIHRRRPSPRQPRTNPLKLRRKLFRRLRVGLNSPQRHTVGSRNTNRRRPPHHHGLNHHGHIFIRGRKHVTLIQRQLRLINKPNTFRRPSKRRNHTSLVYLLRSHECSVARVSVCVAAVRLGKSQKTIRHFKPELRVYLRHFEVKC